MNMHELLIKCQAIEGLTLSQLAAMLSISIPHEPLKRKGWVGQAIELALGADAGTKAIPDFPKLGIELKTLPINQNGKPAESTFVTTISLMTIHKEFWETSQCFAKLKKVLWLPIESDNSIPFQCRRIGQAILWSPNAAEERILQQDWEELTWLIVSGKLGDIHAGIGQYLQIRPKAQNSKALCYGVDESGNKTLTLPRGFYLRSRFTHSILQSHKIANSS